MWWLNALLHCVHLWTVTRRLLYPLEEFPMAAGRMTTNPAAVSNTDSFPVGHGASLLLGAPGNSLFPHPVQLLGPGGPPSLQHLLEWTHLFSTSDPPASRFHLEHPWGDVGPIASSPHLRVLHHIHKIPFALEGDTFTGSRAGTVTSFTGHYSASHNYYLGPS